MRYNNLEIKEEKSFKEIISEMNSTFLLKRFLKASQAYAIAKKTQHSDDQNNYKLQKEMDLLFDEILTRFQK